MDCLVAARRIATACDGTARPVAKARPECDVACHIVPSRLAQSMPVPIRRSVSAWPVIGMEESVSSERLVMALLCSEGHTVLSCCGWV